MAAATKKAYPWKAGASNWHITNLKQSILETFNIYGLGTACSALYTFSSYLELKQSEQSS
jgi:hypothetical protein